MSLDVDLRSPGASGPERWALFIREDGATKEITLEEWNKRYPGKQPCLVHVGGNDTLYSANITHNLGKMADAAGIYKYLWHPEVVGIKTAGDLIDPLTVGLAKLKADPDAFRIYNAPNGWGKYENLVSFVEAYLDACIAYPSAEVYADR
jgi:hypothetical protein